MRGPSYRLPERHKVSAVLLPAIHSEVVDLFGRCHPYTREQCEPCFDLAFGTAGSKLLSLFVCESNVRDHKPQGE